MQAPNQTLFPIESLIPVCVGDLPSHSFSVSSDDVLENVVKMMERRPDLPGMIVVGKNVGIISRSKMFERLGHQYGVELFLRKPVLELQMSLNTSALLVPAHTRIEETVKMALARPTAEIYDPVVVTGDDQESMHLVDMHVLLMAQSSILSNMANTVGQLEQLERLFTINMPADEILLSSLELLSHVVPYHQAAILVQKGERLDYIARRGIGWGHTSSSATQNIGESPIYQMMLDRQEAVCLPDVNMVADWERFGDLGNPRSWLGVPLTGYSNLIGLLSLGRLTYSPFSITEKDTASVFAGRIIQSMENKRKSLVWQSSNLPENSVTS